MLFGSDHNDVHHLAKHAGKIGDALALAEAGILAQHEAAAAQVDDARLEADAGPQRLLFKQECEHAPRQKRFLPLVDATLGHTDRPETRLAVPFLALNYDAIVAFSKGEGEVR